MLGIHTSVFSTFSVVDFEGKKNFLPYAKILFVAIEASWFEQLHELVLALFGYHSKNENFQIKQKIECAYVNDKHKNTLIFRHLKEYMHCHSNELNWVKSKNILTFYL